MQEHKQINKVYYLAFIELHFEIKMQQVDGAKRQVMWGKKSESLF